MSPGIEQYYQEELYQLRQRAGDFSKRYPSLAPMLGNPSSDPDVERLLEGVAYLTGLLRHRLDDELPEVIHGLLQSAFPHYLRPIPSCTLMQFEPLPGLLEPLVIKRNTQVASRPVDGTRCLFQTTSELTLWPLQLRDVQYLEETGRSARIRLTLHLEGLNLAIWKADKLRFYLSGPFNRATDLYYLLNRQLDSVQLHLPGEKGSCHLPPSCVRCSSFDDEALLPTPSQAFPGYRLLQEYLLLPRKFLFFDLCDLDRWQHPPAKQEFCIDLVLKKNFSRAERVTKDDFQLFTVPACNLFEHDGTPITLDHQRSRYRVSPMTAQSGHYQVHSILDVTGVRQGSLEKRRYQAFESFHATDAKTPVFTPVLQPARSDSGTELLLEVTLPPGENPRQEVLSLQLQCSNGALPETLNRGDISEPTSMTPGRCRFSNIIAPTPCAQPPLGDELLWTFQSLLSLNFSSLAQKDNLKELLRLHLQCTVRRPDLQQVHERRIESIKRVEAGAARRLLRGVAINGYRIALDLDETHFAGFGDLFLFVHMLDGLFATYLPVNSFSQLCLSVSPSGEEYLWPARTGDRQLI